MSDDAHLHTMRLQRFLARAGVASRRGSERLMREGRVKVNGHVAQELGTKICTETDEVSVDDIPVHFLHAHTHIMLFKPKGYLSTMHDPHARATVAELVDTKNHPGLFCVGRLDKDTTGLLLFTTDGDLAEHLLHPRFEKEKTYIARVHGSLSASEQDALKQGVLLEDGMTAPAKVNVSPAITDPDQEALGPTEPGQSLVELSIHEGKKHIVKRMLARVGHPVIALHRTAFGPLTLTGLLPGQARELSKQEAEQVYEACSFEPKSLQ